MLEARMPRDSAFGDEGLAIMDLEQASDHIYISVPGSYFSFEAARKWATEVLALIEGR